MENSQVKQKRQYKKRKLSVPEINKDDVKELDIRLNETNGFGKEHRRDPVQRDYQRPTKVNCTQRAGMGHLLDDSWKRLKDRWVNEEHERQRASKITKYFSVTFEKYSRDELAAKLANEKDDEALAPEEQPLPFQNDERSEELPIPKLERSVNI